MTTYKGLPENARLKYDALVQQEADASALIQADIAKLQNLMRGQDGGSPEALSLEARIKMRRALQTNLKAVIDKVNIDLRRLPEGTKLFDVEPDVVNEGDDDLTKIEALRLRISQGREQYRITCDLPPTAAEMQQTIEERVDSIPPPLIGKDGVPQFQMLRGVDPLEAQFAFYMRDAMVERLFARYVEQTPADDLGTADRLTRLAVISDDLDKLERYDEACTALALSKGKQILRRTMADAGAILGYAKTDRASKKKRAA